MSLPADTPPAVANALGYLQHHLQELTEHQNASEHIINNVSPSYQPSFPGPVCPDQTADETKTPFSAQLLQ